MACPSHTDKTRSLSCSPCQNGVIQDGCVGQDDSDITAEDISLHKLDWMSQYDIIHSFIRFVCGHCCVAYMERGMDTNWVIK